MLTTDQKAELGAIAAAVVECERVTGCPAELTAAQWIVESNWGQNVYGNNAFGIKWYPGVPYDRQLLRTREWFNAAELAAFMAKGEGRTAEPDLAFDKPQITTDQKRGHLTLYKVRDFFGTWKTLAEGFEYHGRLLQQGRYQAGWLQYQKDHDLAAYCRAIGVAGYSTTVGYGNIIATWATLPDVVAMMAGARSRP